MPPLSGLYDDYEEEWPARSPTPIDENIGQGTIEEIIETHAGTPIFVDEHTEQGTLDGTIETHEETAVFMDEHTGQEIPVMTGEFTEQEVNEIPTEKCLAGVIIPRQTVNTSAFEGFEPPFPKSTEKTAVDALLAACSDRNTYGDDEFVSFQLEDFVVYRDPFHHPDRYGMISLHDVASGNVIFFVDGIVRPEGADAPAFYLQRVPCTLVSLGGYEDVDCHGVGNDIWIQSAHCRQRGEIWYRLGKPAREYRPYYRPFLWVANLAKHFVDYLHANQDVTLTHFQTQFHDWLCHKHNSDSGFRSWLDEFARKDYRQPIVAHRSFLLGQALSINRSYATHTLWSEIGLAGKSIIPVQRSMIASTVVTQYVYECFKKMGWSHHLKVINPNPETISSHRRLLRVRGFYYNRKKIVHSSSKDSITIGDVVAVHRDQKTAWKSEDDLWYGLVQKVFTHSLGLIWLYRPTDTLCANLTYPSDNELFLSNHCNCHDSKIKMTEVVKKVSVTFFSDKAEKTDFFIRQTYHSDDETFTTLKKQDFQCKCGNVEEPSYSPGDTVLVETSDVLEPVQIVEFLGHEVKVRVLLRRARDFTDSSCRPNELVYTERFRVVHFEQIQRRCYIRICSEDERGNLPVPFDRDGQGAAFYITCEETAEGLRPMATPTKFPELEVPKKKLRALNLFSGGGNFDRGLGEGGAIQNEWAVEWGQHQMLTYRANHESPEDVKLFCGSVNDYLSLAIKGAGSKSDLVAKLGQVEFISGGSPCQGYSQVNYLKQSEDSLRNSSMIASVAAYVDFYRPKYAILENVPAMANKTHPRNPLSQLICAFVGMGYQLRLMHLDAWSYGAPQSRSRLFILIAAPGLQLPDHPPLTHSHPETTKLRALGEAPNGLPFGERRWDTPVFKFVSAREGTKDLPDIDRAKVMSIPWPDHRPSRNESHHTQAIIDEIPRHPRMLGLVQALPLMNYDPYPNADPKRKTGFSRSWSRIHPDQLMPTITTCVSPQCRFTGRWVHWRENRLVTVMETRRAQGYPDSEVLIGRATEQWQIVGNSVARPVALALGLSIREACLRNPSCPELDAEAEKIAMSDRNSTKRRLSEVVMETTTTVVTQTTTTVYRFEDETSNGSGTSKPASSVKVVNPSSSAAGLRSSLPVLKKAKLVDEPVFSDDDIDVID